ncbi:FAD-dependent monooxygenase [Alkanindiges sp. WGS2144]|uniref:FAD-dependent monooxygenase n=1 Tax=Alkanindiges sp. WGS2144 TaxID=3366808 RepID=UPI003750D324
MSDHEQIAQVVIVGGGLVGGLCALLLAKAGVQPIVLDAAPELDTEILQRRDPRVLALSPATISLLRYTDVWSHIERKADYYGMQVWSRDGYGTLDFGQTDSMAPHTTQDLLGSMVEPGVLGLAIQQELKKQIQQYHTQVRVQCIEPFTDYWQVTLTKGQQFNTALLIGADGGNSLVRQAAGIGIDTLDYQQTAISCAIKTVLPHQHIARQVFLPTGPLAFLPMTDLDKDMQPDDQSGLWQSVVWTLPEQDAQELNQLSDADFLSAITQASGYMLGQVVAVESRASFPLKARQAERYILPHLALIGDAAHTVHPLAGQGVNLGCLDAAVLVDTLMRDHERGLWAHWQTLNRYENARRLNNSLMMHSFSALNWLHGSQLKALQWLRSEGTHAVANYPFLIELFTGQASGQSAIKDTRYYQF